MKRLRFLDLLRALAILLVMGRHMKPAWMGNHPALIKFNSIWKTGGWAGVDLFFVLSGFLVSGLLFREFQRHQTVRPGYFLLRRGLKIYPAFYVFLAFTVLYQNPLPREGGLHKLLSEVFFVQNYFRGLWNHTWSLAVEEHFYFLLTLIIVLLVRFQRDKEDPFRAIPWIFAAIAVTSLYLRFDAAASHRFSLYNHLAPTHLRIDSLLFGVVLAYFFHFHSDRFELFCKKFRWPLVIFGIACYFPVFYWQLGHVRHVYTWGFSLLFLGSGMLLCGLLAIQLPRWRLLNGIAWVGGYSYSIYLWHMVIQRWGMLHLQARTGLPKDSPWNLPVYLLASIAVGVVMAKVVEFPALKLRDRIWPSRSGRLIAADQSAEAVLSAEADPSADGSPQTGSRRPGHSTQ